MGRRRGSRLVDAHELRDHSGSVRCAGVPMADWFEYLPVQGPVYSRDVCASKVPMHSGEHRGFKPIDGPAPTVLERPYSLLSAIKVRGIMGGWRDLGQR